MLKKNKKDIIKNVLLLTFIFSLILFFTIWSFFIDYKNKSIEYSNVNYELSIEKFNNQIKEKVLLFDKNSIQFINQNIKKDKYIKEIKITQNRYLFNKDTLLFQTKSFNDSSWNLTNVTVDYKYGEIQKLAGNSFYEFIPSATFDKNEKVVIRYQLFKNEEIKNFLIFVDINLFDIYKDSNDKQIKESFIDSFAKIDSQDAIKKDLIIKNIVFANIEYKKNNTFIEEDISSFLNKLLIYSIVICILMFLLVWLYQKYLKRKYLLKPLRYLDSVVVDLVNSKFTNINTNKFSKSKDYNKVLTNLSKLSSNIASLKNELNINKETLERNLLTDNLTGLPDKKMFDIDMKSMFVYSGEGYLFSLKIAKLDEIVKLNGSLNTDNFILSFTNIINNIISDYKEKNINFYRFYGSEFIIIAREINYEQALAFSNKIIDSLLVQITKSYKLPENIFHIGGTPFDAYGTTNSIMKSVEEAYNSAMLNNINCSVIIKESQIQKNVLALEDKVKSIISNSNFTIDFIFDTYSLENELLMKELKPILKDNEGKVLPIGSFIAISEKLRLNEDFDKEVILKTINFIEANKIDYKLAINLSIKTISSISFIEFITTLSKQKADTLSHILFSITSYSASAYKVEFSEFVKLMNDLNIQILIKRFKTKEFPLEELESIKIDYIKMDRDLTQNVHNDLIKKHRVKNIVIFGELNDVKILAENVESDNDYRYLSKLDIYAINR